MTSAYACTNNKYCHSYNIQNMTLKFIFTSRSKNILLTFNNCYKKHSARYIYGLRKKICFDFCKFVCMVSPFSSLIKNQNKCLLLSKLCEEKFFTFLAESCLFSLLSPETLRKKATEVFHYFQGNISDPIIPSFQPHRLFVVPQYVNTFVP